METYVEEFDGSPWILGDDLIQKKSVFFYCDDNWNLVDKSVATRTKVEVYNKETGKLITLAWCTREKKNKIVDNNRNKEIIEMLEKQDEINRKLYPQYY